MKEPVPGGPWVGVGVGWAGWWGRVVWDIFIIIIIIITCFSLSLSLLWEEGVEGDWREGVDGGYEGEEGPRLRDLWEVGDLGTVDPGGSRRSVGFEVGNLVWECVLVAGTLLVEYSCSFWQVYGAGLGR